MSSAFLGKTKPFNRYAILYLQQRQLEAHFPFLRCSISHNNVLTAIGWIQPEGCGERYKIQLEYVAGNEPKSTILSPYIQPSRIIHMYGDHSLCLHYPPDMKWSVHTPIYAYSVSWITEWIIFYELYLINGGIWEGPESPTHFTEADMNINKDL